MKQDFHVCIVDDDPMARMIAADALAARLKQTSAALARLVKE